jgi:WD40 repeat protein
MHLARRAWDDADIQGTLDLLKANDRPRQGEADPDLRGVEWYYLWRLWRADLLTLNETDPVRSVRFSSDGMRLASASREVQVWDGLTAREILSPKGHTGEATAVCFSPDNQRLPSASVDGEVKVWDARTGQEIRSLKQTGGVRSICFSPDGKRLATVSPYNTVNLRDVQTARKSFPVKGSSTMSGS